jgi:hypothetical protein
MRVISIALATAALFLLCQGCGSALTQPNNGLRPGLNYMQPMKWRMTYRYRVRDIKPMVPLETKRKAAVDPNVAAVGKGTWEVWMDAPKEGEELRGLKMVECTMEPTKTTTNDEGMTLYYFDLAPDGYLPQEAQFSISWEFVTFERYAYWQGMKPVEYDKSSDFYKHYTQLGGEFTISKAMKKEILKALPEDTSDPIKTALACYNYILNNFTYDFSQGDLIAYTGMQATTDSYRCWQNRTGMCDEFANVMCAMLRCAGIPCRPVAGMSHEPLSMQKLGAMAGSSDITAGVGANARVLKAAGHAWVEFYLPNYGWVPVDPTWGLSSNTVTIDPMLSQLGQVRGISFADYYFGKSDPYRIPWQKYWGINLVPAPKTPGAKKSEVWFIGATERRSGVKDIEYGWEGLPGSSSSFGSGGG